ncbi:SDR family oxidoreductase [Sphingomonas sp. GlSt437]|uniref:SDR family oxidoreductase n=1 Tax=Sphingomonas sp. GlSt437 TaxID=3389970 RepID=UPI003A8C4688
MAKLEGKVALVTGGTSGIGLATAKLFGAEGARVIITGRRKPELDAAVAAIPGAKGYQVDSASLDQLDDLFSAIGADHGQIHILFVNAGGGALLSLAEMTEAHFDDTYARNVKGVVFTVNKALPLLATGASVILNGSTSAAKATPGFSIYASSKAAVHALTRNWMVELKERGIRINTLVPGPTATPGLRGLAGPNAAQQQALLEQAALGVPLGRVGDAEEIAHAALFLASNDSSFMTGSELFVDGGEGHA